MAGLTINHKFDDEQKDELKAELDEAVEQLRENSEKLFESMRKTQELYTNVVIGTAIVSFVVGYLVGRSER